MDKSHLAVCHCKTSHPELFLYKSDGSKISFRSDGLKDKIDYVEDECEDALRWKDISASSKDYIWPIYCPIYGTLKRQPKKLDDEDALRNILVDGWKILKPNGKVFISVGTNDNSELFVDKLNKFNELNENNPWKISLIKAEELDFIVHDSRTPKFKEYIILEKSSNGGRRRKTLRNKRIRNVTKYRRVH